VAIVRQASFRKRSLSTWAWCSLPMTAIGEQVSQAHCPWVSQICKHFLYCLVSDTVLHFIEDIIQMDCLPEVFDPNSVGFHELKACEICEVLFNLTQRRHHCRRCGKSVCNKCSANMKPLSRQDTKTLYRVCDACDTEIENFKVGSQNQ